MIDSNKNDSSEVEITYKQTGKKEYLITIIPSDEWLQTAVYPVKIDPTIQIEHDVTKHFVKDKYVFDTNGVEDYQNFLKIGNNGTHKYRSYIWFAIDDVPDTSFITYAHINYLKYQSTFAGSAIVQVKEVEKSHQYHDIKGEGLDITKKSIIDYVDINSTSPEIVTFDLTSVVEQWHQVDRDSGIFELSTLDETVVENYTFTSSEKNVDITLPTVVIGYADSIGMKNYWTYQSYSADNAGTIFVSDYTGKVTAARQDIMFSNERQSFELSMIYDQSRYDVDNGYGAGWLTNYNIILNVSNPDNPTITDASGATSHFYESTLCPDPDKFGNYTCYMSDNGSNDYLVHNVFVDLDWEEWFYTPQLGVEYRFNSNGSLKSITNNLNQADYTNNDMILFEYVTGSATKISEIKLCNDVVDTNGTCNHNRVSFNYTNGLLDTLTLELIQGDGTYNDIEKIKYNYIYESSIGENVIDNIGYSNKYKETDYSSVGGATYDYNQDGFLKKLHDDFGVNVNILYDSNNSVDNVNISNGTNKIEDFDYSYIGGRTTITTHNGDYIRMLFDIYGHTIQTYNNKGFVELKEYNQSNPYFTNRLASYTPSTLVEDENNIIVNPSFEKDTSGWTMNGNTTVTYNMFKDLYYFIGSKGVKIDGTIYQTKTIDKYITDEDEDVLSQINKNMTLSGWVRIENGSPSDRVEIIVTAYKISTTPTPIVLKFDPKTDTWQFKTQDILLEENPDNVHIELIYSGTGTVYFDNIQISPNVSTQYYEYDEDERTLTKVYVSDNSSTEIEYIYDRFNRVIQILEHSNDESGTRITREISKKEYDETNSLILNTSTQNNVKSVYTYNSNGQVTNVQVGDSTTNFSLGVGFNSLYNQYMSSTTDEFGKTTSYVYDELTGLLESLQNPKGDTIEYVYKNNGALEKVINSDVNVIYNYDSENRLDTINLSNGTVYRINYDSMDRIDTISIDGLTNPLIDYSYKTDGDYITGLIETKKYANDDVFKYVYNSDNLVEYVQFKDALGVYENKFYYEYDNYNRVKLLKTYIGGTVLLTENFTYNSQGLLENITDNNGNSINYGYDSNSNLNSLSFDVNDTVSTTNYFYNKHHTVSESPEIYSSLYDRTEFTTQKGDSVVKKYNYEASALYRLDNVNLILNNKSNQNEELKISQNINYKNSTLRITSYEFVIPYTDENNNSKIRYCYYTYSYDNLGNITQTTYIENLILLKSNYEYDEMNQLIIEDVYDSTVDCNQFQDTCYSRLYDYDLQGNLLETRSYKYGERDYTTAPTPYVSGGDIAVGSPNCSLITNSLNIGDAEPTCSFTYYKDGSFPPVILNLTTTMLSSDVDTSTPGYYMQHYKATGSGYTVYIGILFKVGNPPAPGPNTAIDSIKYNYNNSHWGDQLTSYTIDDDGIDDDGVDDDGVTSVISYDDQGNPTKITNFRYRGTIYNHVSLKFSGRTLDEIKIYDKATETTQYLIATISYTYNDQGYRTSKTINGVTTNYTLSGDKVIYETNGEYEIIYTYDVDGTLISFYYDNDITVKKDGNEYFYIKDLQGNISKIVDENGNIVVEYSYDAWGNIISTKEYNTDGTEKTEIDIAKINPYRYRGYRYDEETGWYYLNSRYYNPEIGRFINADGLVGPVGDILGHNMYAYAKNNPVMYIDPNGDFPILAILGTLAVKAIIGATIGGTAAYVVGSIQGKEGSELWNSVKAGATYGGILGFGTGIASGLGIVSATLGWGGTAKVAAWAGGTAISSISGGVAITAQNAILGKETSTTDILFHSFLGGFTGGLSFGVNNKLVYDGIRRMSFYKNPPFYVDVPTSQRIIENMIIGGIEFVVYKGIVAAGRGAYNYLDNKWGY